jgi:hypothetical protein
MDENKLKIKETIERLDLERVRVGSITRNSEFNRYNIEIYGGLNGRGNWDLYLKQIGEIVNCLPEGTINSLNVDNPDDVWVLYVSCGEF